MERVRPGIGVFSGVLLGLLIVGALSAGAHGTATFSLVPAQPTSGQVSDSTGNTASTQTGVAQTYNAGGLSQASSTTATQGNSGSPTPGSSNSGSYQASVGSPSSVPASALSSFAVQSPSLDLLVMVPIFFALALGGAFYRASHKDDPEAE
ncbi:MAG TPA: hypothetical protein VEB67_00575 [Nitrososphaerales archaeon]|nr:hypothetical protein [Nitrososphaerales archaeon]